MKFKAVSLLFIFLLNTAIVFACSIGMDMEFNSSHLDSVISYESGHSHEDANIHQHAKKEMDNCCKNEAVKFAIINKLIPASSNYTLQQIFLPAFLPGFYYVNHLEADTNSPSNRFFVLSYHPPIPDIRVAIQSFQI